MTNRHEQIKQLEHRQAHERWTKGTDMKKNQHPTKNQFVATKQVSTYYQLVRSPEAFRIMTMKSKYIDQLDVMPYKEAAPLINRGSLTVFGRSRDHDCVVVLTDGILKRMNSGVFVEAVMRNLVRTSPDSDSNILVDKANRELELLPQIFLD
jgi:hypothetical protein